ncbi:MAG: TetR/AcrR family transcriptional regulator [Acidimicrobiales bacterium]
MTTPTSPVGRPRDPDLDRAILEAARQHLAAHGYEAMSVLAVAEAAGTTRQALYRRFPSKADLATAAIAGMSRADERPDTGDPYADLVTELRAFHQGVTRPNGLGLVGAMLQDATEPELRSLFRERIVQPRRTRFESILRRGVATGQLAADADIDLAVAACSGTLYALALAGRPVPDWPARTATHVWRACGGTPPPAADALRAPRRRRRGATR